MNDKFWELEVDVNLVSFSTKMNGDAWSFLGLYLAYTYISKLHNSLKILDDNLDFLEWCYSRHFISASIHDEREKRHHFEYRIILFK